MQTIEDTGALTQERMKNFDAGEVIPKALEFIKKANDADEPFFVWLNTSRMHLYVRIEDQCCSCLSVPIGVLVRN